MVSSTCSLHFLSLTPNSLSLSTSKPTSLSLLSSLRTYPSKSISISHSTSPSRFARNVAVSSDFEQDEELSDEEVPNFSPDLKLFVGNLPFNVDSATLAGLFERAGNVEMVEVIYDKMTGRSRGFGFVTMSTVEEVEAAAQQFNGYELEGRPMRVNSGPPPPRREESSFRGSRGGYEDSNRGSRGGYENRGSRGGYDDSNRGSRGGFNSNRGGFDNSSGGSRGGASFGDSNKVYVGNLSWGVDDLALETLFREQGNVREARVIYDRDSGRSKGFGFVTFSSANEVNNAIESLDGADLDGRQIRVSVAEARPKREF
ncbi:hypothetical protein RHGRI_011542 [Rhododendron griersonianum]|uniref:RRM domain-containing protein n=1 Tax=Rhododendron griersonianum TaxID=479676 RepID=A0AAV6KMN2_9ERIC|nr:hypothetical protein RHGRI_011542 [Rhododendron griersonianum]